MNRETLRGPPGWRARVARPGLVDALPGGDAGRPLQVGVAAGEVLGGGQPRVVADLPQQAPNALINTYRELYWRIADEVEKELPGQGRKRAQKVCAGIIGSHKALALLSAPRGVDTPEAVVQPEELASALSDWSLQLLEGVEVMMPGTAPRILQEATKEHRYVLQSAGFYGHLPWQVVW